jgi:glucans biosynthesis protein
VVDVKATLYFRQGVETAGLAPMTSMFWYGEGSPSRYGDFRPEVHDSDGLLVAPDAETRLWRPLQNSPHVRHTDFPAASLAGFGLLQRDRDFRSYEDIEGRYELRPSLWMEPVGEWPAGRVRLVELTARDEYQDNIVAFWTPDAAVEPGKPIELAWRLKWTRAPSFGGPPGWVRATRQTVALAGPRLTKFVVDFDIPGEAQPGPDANVTAELSVSEGGHINYQQVVRNEVDLSYRIILRVEAAENVGTVDLRARLLLDGKPLTETWVYPWTP